MSEFLRQGDDCEWLLWVRVRYSHPPQQSLPGAQPPHTRTDRQTDRQTAPPLRPPWPMCATQRPGLPASERRRRPLTLSRGAEPGRGSRELLVQGGARRRGARARRRLPRDPSLARGKPGAAATLPSPPATAPPPPPAGGAPRPLRGDLPRTRVPASARSALPAIPCVPESSTLTSICGTRREGQRQGDG